MSESARPSPRDSEDGDHRADEESDDMGQRSGKGMSLLSRLLNR